MCDVDGSDFFGKGFCAGVMVFLHDLHANLYLSTSAHYLYYGECKIFVHVA